MTFVNSLLKKFEAKFLAATNHPLTNELCDGTLPDYKLYTYLVQDLKFFQLGLNLLGNTLARCDAPESAIVLGKQIGFISNDENTYFFRCLDQLRRESLTELQNKVPAMLEDMPHIIPEVNRYLSVMDYLAFESKSYEELVVFVYVMEKVYLGWAEVNISSKDTTKLAYKHKEWVDLHSGADFESWVEFLGQEVERVAINDESKKIIENWFLKTLDLEVAFFDGCYYYST